MRIIQSLWARGEKNLLEFNGGWISPEYHLMSWALSSLQLSLYNKELVLYADHFSAKLLVDKLKLPYTKVFCDLDFLNEYDPKLWALPKIYAYSVQEQPFLHVDSDIYIWDKFENSLLDSELIAQNLEIGSDNYQRIFKQIESVIHYFPAEILEERKKNQEIFAYNAGIMGGSNLDFFKIFKKIAFEFVEKNIDQWPKNELADFNILFEQHLFYCLAKKFNIPVGVYFKEIISDQHYRLDFNETPYNIKYTHLIGSVFKRNKKICDQLACRLRYLHPDFYYRIISMFKKSKTQLYRDYYTSISNYSEDNLKNRFLRLDTCGQIESKPCLQVNKELVFFREGLVLKEITELDSKIFFTEEKLNDQLNDVKSLESNIFKVLNRFNNLPIEYLYKRDIISAKSVEFIYVDKLLIAKKEIIVETSFEIITCQFDWSLVDDSLSFKKNILHIFSSKPSKHFIAIVLECDKRGYSLVGIDKLDSIILSLAKGSILIHDLLEKLKSYFQPEDIVDLHRFEKLIHLRLKYLLTNKLIRPFN